MRLSKIREELRLGRFRLKFALIVLIILAGVACVLLYNKDRAVAPVAQETTATADTASDTATATPPETIKEEIAKAPPKIKTSGTATTKKNADGSKTTTASTGPTSTTDTALAAAAGPSGSIAGIDYIDQTGLHPALGDQLKSFMSSNLLVKGEVSSMYSIILKNAGDTGWAGTYSGSYTQNGSGTITSAWGYITLNSYYYEGDPNFNDYMKLILSHEYGHHYTLYYKWVVWQSPYGERFPDAYYSSRSLTKTTTAADYSKGWGNCDAEIIAEDYSYFYSGYGYHGMYGTYGYPPAATKTWIANESSGPGTPAESDNVPSVSITAPSNGATISGSVPLSATASDDHSITKVVFYIDSATIVEDTTAPYETTLASTSYSNGAHTLKAKAYDSAGQTTDSTVSITINNATSDSTNPTVTITDPADNPHSWTSGNLYLKATATDNVAVQKIEFYVNDILVATENAAIIERLWSYAGTPAGSYVLKARSYDTSGNTADASIVINKS